MDKVLCQLRRDFFPFFLAKQEHYTNMIFVKLELPNYIIDKELYKSGSAFYIGYDINKYGVPIEWK